ncbi:hypothetical protein [Pelagicoccus sp. SDUM812003]|uniref:c-type cytochrome n=1 Tax=Pelagicoccus sp. SDUM812003 TaxID=3041267 RepID=UPI00280D37A8|nr:hypothetical protein [Pelagicoccus sp. SDUM812003]MDQ8202917.1 hypothetical protein [Pelagicoccus sp. SDUM812003]
MKTKTCLLSRPAAFTLLLLAWASINPLYSESAPTSKTSSSSQSEQVERGRYLVHSVAMCIDCHSPRGPDGQFLEGKDLTGSPLAFVATVPMPWAPLAPNLAGLPPHYDEASMITFLMTGERPHGLGPTLPPMPTIRLDQDDAIAVTKYLMSLKKNS